MAIPTGNRSAAIERVFGTRSISDGQVVVVEATNLTGEAVTALRQSYPDLSWAEGRIEIKGENISQYDILRPRGVVVESTFRKRVTLDDVFLELTGKPLRE